MHKQESLLDKLQVFEKMYEIMRIVDPLSKRVLEVKENEFFTADIACYDYWKRNQLCENCISMRAFNEDETIFKMEYNDGKVFMITAVPVMVGENRLIVELLKNTTNSMLVGDDKAEGTGALTMIEYMNQAAVKDPLTDVYNRRYINERLPVDLLNSSLKSEPLSVIFTDLDYFKKINDTYGHLTGDSVLQQFSKELKGFIRRDTDWVARFGGEEFLICLTNTDLDTAKRVAERIRHSIENKEFVADGKRINITCSFGVHAVCNDKECTTAEGVIKLVDQHLYRAKNLGRNRVE